MTDVMAAYRWHSMSRLGSSGLFLLLLGGGTTSQTVLEASTNLLQWLPIYTNLPSGVPVEFGDPASTSYRLRFYRARAQP